MTNILDFCARIIISALFFTNGVFKIMNYDGTVNWMEGYGVPGILIIPAIILEILGPVLIILGYKIKITAAILSVFCLATAFIFHNDFSNQMQLTSFLKNIALLPKFSWFLIDSGKNPEIFGKFFDRFGVFATVRQGSSFSTCLRLLKWTRG